MVHGSTQGNNRNGSDNTMEPRTLEDVFAGVDESYVAFMELETDADWKNPEKIADVLLKINGAFNNIAAYKDPWMKDYIVYAPMRSCGIWSSFIGPYGVWCNINDVRGHIHNHLIPRCRWAISTVTRDVFNITTANGMPLPVDGAGGGNVRATDDGAGRDDVLHRLLSERIEELKVAYKRLRDLGTLLGTCGPKRRIGTAILERRRLDSMVGGGSQYDFDSQGACVPFTDGIYDIEKMTFVTGDAALKYKMSETVGYSYADVMGGSEETMAEFQKWFAQTFSDPVNRAKVIKVFRDALRGREDGGRPRVVVHANMTHQKMPCGITTFFQFVKEVFGGLYECIERKSLFVHGGGAGSAAKIPRWYEKTVHGMHGKLVLVTRNLEEDCEKKVIRAAFLNTANALRKQGVTLHVLASNHKALKFCDELEDKMVVIPYTTRFVEKNEDRGFEDGREHTVTADPDVDRHFGVWRLAFMKVLLQG